MSFQGPFRQLTDWKVRALGSSALWVRDLWAGIIRAPVKGKRRKTFKDPAGNLSRIRPEILDFEPEWGLKRSQTKPKVSVTVPTNRHTTIPNDSGAISACFDEYRHSTHKSTQTKPKIPGRVTHKPAHNDSERFWPDFGMVRRRPEIFTL